MQARTNPPITSVARGLDPMGAKTSACPGRCAAWSIKGVYSVSPRRRASTPLCLRGLWRNDALQTPISGLPEIGTQICASRVNPTCVDRYTRRLRDGPGPAVHRFAIARAAPHPGHVRPYLSAYGAWPAGRSLLRHNLLGLWLILMPRRWMRGSSPRMTPSYGQSCKEL